jgi:WD40 repeat protein
MLNILNGCACVCVYFTQSQLFKKAHVARQQLPPVPDFFLHPWLLQMVDQRSIGYRVQHMIGLENLRLLTVGPNQLLTTVPFESQSRLQYQRVAWGFPDGTLRVSLLDDDALQMLYKNMHDGPITVAILSPDLCTLITGGQDSVLGVWRKQHLADRFEYVTSLCGHHSSICALAMTKTYSLIVSGARDSTLLVWDLNRLTCIRRLDCFEGQRIVTVAFDESNGDLIVASLHGIHVFDVNMRHVVTHRLPMRLSDGITSMLVLPTPLDQAVDATLCVVTGHQDGTFNVWHMIYAFDSAAAAAAAAAQADDLGMPDDVVDSDNDEPHTDTDATSERGDSKAVSFHLDADADPQQTLASPTASEPGVDPSVAVDTNSAGLDGPSESGGHPHGDGDDDSGSDVDGGLSTTEDLPGQPPAGALDLDVNRDRNPNPLGFTWHLRLVGGKKSAHNAPITAVTLSTDQTTLWVADATGIATAWTVPALSLDEHGVVAVAPLSGSDVGVFAAMLGQKPTHMGPTGAAGDVNVVSPAVANQRVAAAAVEPISGVSVSPCAVCEKTRYRNRERRLQCGTCNQWICVNCRLDHVRTVHPSVKLTPEETTGK